jgi:hypothetical protein
MFLKGKRLLYYNPLTKIIQKIMSKDSVRQKNWFSITAYVVISLSFLTLILIFAETYAPSQSTDLIPRQPDPITRWLFHSNPLQDPQKDAAADKNQQKKLFFQLNQKISIGKAELIYRGLVDPVQFRIDVIIPELDPQASYPYRLKISEAKKSFRLANRNYRLIAAKKGSLQLKLINPP